MEQTNAKRLARSIRRLLSSLDTDTKCYRYQHDPEFEGVKAYLINKANQLDPDRAIPQAKEDPMIDPGTGIRLTPSPNGESCLGNGMWPELECCCDECDYYLICFPEHG